MKHPGFTEAFDNLRRNQANDCQDDLMQACGWSQSTFFNKKTGKVKIKKPEMAVIQEVFAKYGIRILINETETITIQ